MKFKKKIISLGLTLSFVLLSSVTAFAATPTSNSQSNNSSSKNVSGEVSVGSAATRVSNVLTYNELIEQYAKDNNIPEDKAASQFSSNSSSILAPSLTTPLTETPTYRTLYYQVPCFSNYQPTIAFYCQTTEGMGFHGIVKILNVSLIRAYNGISKQFGGTIYTNLEDPNSIYFILNGDFYNTGSTTTSGGVNIGVGQFATVNFGVSTTTNWFGYSYYQDWCTF